MGFDQIDIDIQRSIWRRPPSLSARIAVARAACGPNPAAGSRQTDRGRRRASTARTTNCRKCLEGGCGLPNTAIVARPGLACAAPRCRSIDFRYSLPPRSARSCRRTVRRCRWRANWPPRTGLDCRLRRAACTRPWPTALPRFFHLQRSNRLHCHARSVVRSRSLYTSGGRSQARL